MPGAGRMKIEVRNQCTDFASYRAARVKTLFNVESGANFDLDADLPIEGWDWKLGVIVGPSGSGKTSMGRLLFGGGALYEPDGWAHDAPIIDCIAPDGDFDAVTGALSAVGLGSVPSWLRPYPALSNGEKFRADLARVVSDAPAEIVIDEFSSVVDRQIAKIGAMAFQKAWRRTNGKAVLLSCHYDILDWLEPDWVFDTSTGNFQRGRDLWRRPNIHLDIHKVTWSYWPLFEPHHYLKAGPLPSSEVFVGFVDGEPVAHVGITTMAGAKTARACRLVVMPEWQGAGVGVRFLNYCCQRWAIGEGLYKRPMPLHFHTGHPGLANALRRSPRWVQNSARLHSSHKTEKLIARETKRAKLNALTGSRSALFGGHPGHFRPVQGFRYLPAPLQGDEG